MKKLYRLSLSVLLLIGVVLGFKYWSIFGNPFAPKITLSKNGQNVIYIAQPTISRFSVTYHAPSQSSALGDRDGIDYVPYAFINGRFQQFKTDGSRNEDFFGFGMSVISPIDGSVTEVKNPDGVNPIGKMGATSVGFVVIKSLKDEYLVLAHLADIKVQVGQTVKTGEALGVISNNGFARMPHIHLGAYKNGKSLLIEFDRAAIEHAYQQYNVSEK